MYAKYFLFFYRVHENYVFTSSKRIYIYARLSTHEICASFFFFFFYTAYTRSLGFERAYISVLLHTTVVGKPPPQAVYTKIRNFSRRTSCRRRRRRSIDRDGKHHRCKNVISSIFIILYTHNTPIYKPLPPPPPIKLVRLPPRRSAAEIRIKKIKIKCVMNRNYVI